MFSHFQLTVACSTRRGPTTLFRVPMSDDLQRNVTTAWYGLYERTMGHDQVPFDPAYTVVEGQIFRVDQFALPPWLREHDIESVREIDVIPNNETTFRSIQCILAIAWDTELDEEILLFQNFTSSKVISPSWRSMVFFNDLYQQSERYGLQLNNTLSAVFSGTPDEGALLFFRVRDVNTYLPMDAYYREATEGEIRRILDHPKLSVEDADSIIQIAGPWYARRFLMLADSGILDTYEATLLRDVGARLDVQLQIDGDAIRLPSERMALRTILSFLNEERFRGAITDYLYEAASRRKL